MEDDRLRRAMRWSWLLLVAAAAIDAARTRRLHGQLGGVVPYDFRVPTIERAKQRTWNPRSSRVLTPTTFGVGWSVNLGRLARLAGLA